MYLLLTDETNLNAGDFFAYGGLVVPFDRLASLHNRIKLIRESAGYNPGNRLKFDTNSRPQQVTPEAALGAKRDVIAACIDHDCRFLAYLVLKAIARAQGDEVTLRWAVNSLLSRFNLRLQELNSHGIVAVDRLPNGAEFDHLVTKFTEGITTQEGAQIKLDRVLLLSSTCINASHVSSAMDIVLGSLRYCINKQRDDHASREMMPQLVRLMGYDQYEQELKWLLLRPKQVGNAEYRARYQALLEFIYEYR